MRLTPGQGVGLVLLAVILTAIAVTDVSAPASCGDANASLKGGLLDDAKKGYATILDDDPQRGCAVAGMAEVAKQMCRRAADTGSAGHPDDADKVYSAALAMEPPGDVVKQCQVTEHASCPKQDKTAPASCVTGPPGPPGQDGVDGVDGTDGVDGQDGKDGKDGVDGKDGQDGKNGKNGSDGRDGTDGRDGADGKNGRNGRDAKPCCTG
jgi:hypothetical protein